MLDKSLLYFIKVAEEKSFTKAAEELFISQSTISKAVRSLEEKFSVELIDRSPHKFEITKNGKYVYDFAKELIEFYEEKQKELDILIENESNILKFGLPPSAGSIYFHSLISEFQRLHPHIKLIISEMTSTNIVKSLIEDKLDMGVVVEPLDFQGLTIKKVFQSEAVLVVSNEHHLAKESKVDFASLANENFLQISKDYMYYDLFNYNCKLAGFKANIIFENYQWDLILEMVIDNQGVTILPKPLIDKFLQGRGQYLKLENPKFPWALSIAYSKNKIITKPMKKFIDICNERKIKDI